MFKRYPLLWQRHLLHEEYSRAEMVRGPVNRAGANLFAHLIAAKQAITIIRASDVKQIRAGSDDQYKDSV